MARARCDDSLELCIALVVDKVELALASSLLPAIGAADYVCGV